MITLRCINDNGVKFDLDLFQNEELRLDISAIESTEIGEVFGVSSQTFALPGTTNNNEFFGNLYDLGSTPATTFTKTVPCQVLYNGARVFTGKLYLSDIVTNQQGDTVYNVVVVNEVVDFKFEIQDLRLSDLDWSEYDHTLTMANVTSSWEDNLFSGDIKYPLINYGIDTSDVNSTSIEAGGEVGMFDNSDSPLRAVDFRPAIKAKAVIDKIFDSVQYTYSSSFLNSDYFNNLYILATEGEGGNQFANPTTASLDARVASTQNLTNNTSYILDFATEIYDNGNNWATNTFTAPTDSDYTLYAQIKFGAIFGTRPTSGEFLFLEWWDPIGNVVLADTVIDITGTQGPLVFIGPTTLNLEAGDQVQLLARVSTNPVYSATYPVVNGKITSTGAPTKVGGDVNMSYVWGKDTKIIDFLDGLIQKFNLVFEPLVTERNNIIIEPFDTWVDEGQIVDWTDRVDRNVKWQISHPLQSQPKNIKFTDVPDTDALNKYTTDKFKKTYGEFRYNSDSDLAIGEKTIGTFFSPTPIKYIDGATPMILPTLAEKTPGEPLTPYKFNPRILYDVGMVSGSSYLRGYDTSTSTYDYGNYWVQEDGATVVKKDEYPLFHHLSYTVDSNGVIEDATDSTIDLHFGNGYAPGHWSYHQNQYNAYTKRSAFYQYWAFYLNELYDIDSRKVTLNIKLNPYEIQDIRLNDKIFIDGHYYRIDLIKGANLINEDSVEVTLLKTLPRKLKFPRRRIVIDDIATDYTVDDASFSLSGGGIIYIDYDTGLVLSGSGVTEAASLDGFISYNNGSEVVWKTNAPVTYTLSAQNNFGNNEVRSSALKVNVTGENNVIREQARQVNVVGESNVVSEYTSYSSIVGQNNFIDTNSNDVNVFGSSHEIISGSSNSVILGGSNNTVNSSSLVAMVGGAGNVIKDSQVSRNAIVGSLNTTISSSQDTVFINGNGETATDMNGNTLIGNFQSVTDLSGDDYRSGTNIIAGTYLEEDYYTNRNSYQITAYSGSSEAAYSGTGLYKYIYEVDFSEVISGSGEGEIVLPTIVSQEQIGRTILFKASNTVNASNVVNIVSFGGTDLIEGRSNYVLERPGQFVELRASQFEEGEALAREWRVISAGIPFESNVTNEGAYGSFYSTGSQAISVSGSEQLVTFGNTFTSNLISLSGSGAIELEYKGAYSFTYTAKVQNFANEIQYADFWVKYNGTDYPNSTVRAAIPARKNASTPTIQPVTVQILDVAVNNGDKIELYWRGDSTELSLIYQTFGGTIPAAPSIRATIHAV